MDLKKLSDAALVTYIQEFSRCGDRLNEKRARALEELSERYEVEVFSVAMNLTSDEDSSREVVEEVMGRICRDIDHCNDKDINAYIHSLSYDAALAKLVAGRALGGSFKQLFSIGQALVAEGATAKEPTDDKSEVSGIQEI
ncbi:MAG: hypothetical protein PHC51_09030 [bacterium]|nr:hypothetical protein [bacterium]